MNKKLTKYALSFLMLLVLVAPIVVCAQYGDELLEDLIIPQPEGEDTLPTIIINIINIVLGLLALIAVVIILIAGFEWMTAGGSEDKVKNAQNRLKYGLIGLVIIFLAYGVATWVINILDTQLRTAG